MIAKIPQSGRAHELSDWLAGIQQDPHQRGDSPLYLVLGQAGVGKTRVLKQYLSSAGPQVYSFAVPEKITLANPFKEPLVDLHMGSASRAVFELIEEVKDALSYDYVLKGSHLQNEARKMQWDGTSSTRMGGPKREEV